MPVAFKSVLAPFEVVPDSFFHRSDFREQVGKFRKLAIAQANG